MVAIWIAVSRLISLKNRRNRLWRWFFHTLDKIIQIWYILVELTFDNRIGNQQQKGKDVMKIERQKDFWGG